MGDARELTRLKMELVSTRDAGETGVLGRMVLAHPEYVAELAEFDAALIATSAYEHVALSPETMGIAQRAAARAFEMVFPPQASAEPAGGFGARAVATLKALRRARGLTLSSVARQLGLGLDVVADLEAGVVRAASVPDRLTRALGELLQTTADQMRAVLETQPVVRPGYARDKSSSQDIPMRDFAEAVRLSTSMSVEQKDRWLAE
jgi:transcriptional regulator with XRE-family HTH domain